MIYLYAVSGFTENTASAEKEAFMREAIREAEKAGDCGDVPIGAVIVKGGEIIARGANRTEADADPTMHAEIIAIREAAKAVGSPRLVGCEMYVTVEPCSMCAGACVLARLEAVYAGASSPKSGAAGSVKDILTAPGLNHQLIYEVGVLQEECAGLLKEFFAALRREH
jgi:tRNA(adenine34) deaminase